MVWCETTGERRVRPGAQRPAAGGDQLGDGSRAHRVRSDRQTSRPVQGLPLVHTGKLEPYRLVNGNGEWTRGEANSRFIVTSL
jgi:hypothetical protein